jgi:hypothetical protein
LDQDHLSAVSGTDESAAYAVSADGLLEITLRNR